MAPIARARSEPSPTGPGLVASLGLRTRHRHDRDADLVVDPGYRRLRRLDGLCRATDGVEAVLVTRELARRHEPDQEHRRRGREFGSRLLERDLRSPAAPPDGLCGHPGQWLDGR